LTIRAEFTDLERCHVNQQTFSRRTQPRRSLVSLGWQWLASLKLAVALLVALAAVLAWATLLEASRGREFAAWYVYSSPWFVAILALLGANILCAALIRLPWRTHQIGFVITHAGLLVLLVGAIQTFMFGVEGQVMLQEGAQTDTLTVTSRSLIRVVHPTDQGQISTEFTFSPGPADWREGDILDFGQSKGLGLKVLKFYRHAREEVEWVEDPLDFSGPALKLRLNGPSGNTIAEDWLAGNLFGGEAVIGPTEYQLWSLPVETMTEDFLNPPTDPGKSGTLAVHYEGRRYLVPVEENLQKRFPVGETGIEVEIVGYYPDSRPSPKGGFISRSDEPKNPLLELKVYFPGEAEPTSQIALARRPLLNMDGVRGKICPVRFWYHHANVPPTAGADFVQTPEGKLYCRATINGAYVEPVAVAEGGDVPLGGQFSISVVRHLARAREEVRFRPVQPPPGARQVPEAAVLVEVTAEDLRREVWLQRQDPRWALQTIMIGRGPVMVSFDYQKLPLGYTLRLNDFQRDLNPGRAGNAAFASRVQLIDESQEIDQQREISMNEPLSHGKFTFYQSSFQDAGHGVEASVLTAAYDPGRSLKYLGSLMICAGIFVMFYLRSYMFKSVPSFVRRRPSVESPSETVSENTQTESSVPKPLALPRRRSEMTSKLTCNTGDS